MIVAIVRSISARQPTLAVCLLVAGCALPSEAPKIGEATYATSANASAARGGEASARRMALTNADKKCESMGKQTEVINTDTRRAFPDSVVTVTFKCK
jgi:hypothetical protein